MRMTQLLLGCVSVCDVNIYEWESREGYWELENKNCKGMYKIDWDERPELREGLNRSD